MQGKLLDIGCGSKPYKDLFVHITEYIGIDVDTSGHDHKKEDIDLFFNGIDIPFPDNYFDSLLCSEVLEHVENLSVLLSEANRVLRPGGKFLVTTPFVWNEHEMPYDFLRFTQQGMRKLLDDSGFTVVEMHKSGTFSQVVAQLQMLYISSKLPEKNKFFKILFNVLFVSPVTLIGLIKILFLPGDTSLYFNNIVFAQKQNSESTLN
ncbi:MAG: class I SAM-dependent methyltransferase [Bacteroidales bacterium]|nr:class I SAM-dependent methyltransferase [Bacteroidales bacterium]